MSKQLIDAIFEHGVLRPLTEIQPPIPKASRSGSSLRPMILCRMPWNWQRSSMTD